jgi:DeoR/GlpR family transcriptional regulator of sugar metabolism
VEENHIVTLPQLSALFPEVSLMTIHRDLSQLQEDGFLVKIRGGARYIANVSNEPAFAAREIVGKSAKQAIAGKAVPFLSGSSSIFIDAGTTMMAFAKHIPDVQANVMTTGPNIALELARKPMMTVNLCGGALNKNNLTLSGDTAIDCLSGINIDTAFVVASGYSQGSGFTCGMESEARIKKLVVGKARTSIVLIDSSKFERMLPYTFAGLSDFSCMITDLDPAALPEPLLGAARAAGLRVV